jgi:hypothetical protein
MSKVIYIINVMHNKQPRPLKRSDGEPKWEGFDADARTSVLADDFRLTWGGYLEDSRQFHQLFCLFALSLALSVAVS